MIRARIFYLSKQLVDFVNSEKKKVKIIQIVFDTDSNNFVLFFEDGK